MNKSEFIDAVAKKSLLSKKDTTAAVNAFQEVITEALKFGDDVQFTGFGKFEVSHRKARDARSPQTGETVHVPAKLVPKFRPGKALKDSLN